MDNLVFEKIVDSINELGFAKWIVLIVMVLTPVIIDIYYKSVNSKYYNVGEKYFNFLSLKKLVAYTCLFIFVILNFTFLFYDLIIHFSLEGAIIYLVLLSVLCISIAIYIFNYMVRIDISIKCLKPILLIGILIVLLFHNFSFKCAIISVLCIFGIIIVANKYLKCNNIRISIYIFINPILFFILSLLFISLISCLIFSDEINENLNNSVEKNLKTNQNQYQYQEISEENKKNNNATKEYLNYVLRNSGDLKAKEFVMLYNNPEYLIRLDVSYKSGVNKSILKLYLVRFFYNVEKANIQKELFASMRLLIILNLLLDPVIFIFAMASIFILIGVLLLLLRNRFFNPNKIKTYEYIDKPGLMKEVVITEYKGKLLVMEGLIYNNNLYLDRTNYRIIDLSDKLKLAQEKFNSIIFDMMDYFITVIIIDYCGKETKNRVDISFNKMKETLRLKIYDNNFNLNEIEISCDVSFKNNCMIIKSEIKHILETIYGINNFKFKLYESAKKNFSIDENTGEITINLDLE